MSYDLYFYKRTGNQLSEEQVAEYLNNNISYNTKEHAKQWSYDNRTTGVYFFIDWDEIEEAPEFLKSFDDFGNFTYLNFTFNINFLRPQYFAVEVFPIIQKFINDLDLFVLNPQDEEDPEIPRKFDDSYLQDQWIRQNDKVSLGQFEEAELEYMPLEKSNYLWLYQFNKQELEDKYSEDHFVPNIFILKSNQDHQLYTACVWPEHIPFILPNVDYLLVSKKFRKNFIKVEESGLVAYKDVLKEFGEAFKSLKHNDIDLKDLTQEKSDGLKKKFNSLKLGKDMDEFGTRVYFDGFVNVRP
jgi:hypothetical protein